MIKLKISDVILESGNGLESNSSPHFSGLGLGPTRLGLSTVPGGPKSDTLFNYVNRQCSAI